jgi:hemolysin activation/secretion protein
VPSVDADLRGYVSLFGPAVLALRGQARHAGAALPISEWALAGGSESVRGYRAGHRAGDSMAAISAEVRVPVTSPLSNARMGVKAFADAGAAWMADASIRKQQFDRGVGAGVFLGWASVTATADIAWPERGRPRVHVQLGITN